MTSNIPQGLCPVCKTITTKLCSGCYGAPAYERSKSKSASPTFYCSAECQRSHWQTHKSECQNLQARKKLVRAGRILQGMFFSIRRHATKIRFNHLSVETTGAGGATKVVLTEPTDLPREDEWTLKTFPDMPKDLNEDVLEGVKMYGACAEAHAYLDAWVKKLLSGVCSEIEEVNFNISGRAQLQISVKDKNGETKPPPNNHYVCCVALRTSNEVWALDLTGAQFGYREVVYSWDEFEHRGGVVLHRCPVGESWLVTTHKNEDEKSELRDELNKHIPALLMKYGGANGNLSGMLKGSDTVFGEVEKIFLGEVEETVKRYMAKFNSPQETRKRNKKMKALLPVPDDPEDKKELANMMQTLASAGQQPRIVRGPAGSLVDF